MSHVTPGAHEIVESGVFLMDRLELPSSWAGVQIGGDSLEVVPELRNLDGFVEIQIEEIKLGIRSDDEIQRRGDFCARGKNESRMCTFEKPFFWC